MRILVCGSRHFDDWNLLDNTLLDICSAADRYDPKSTIIQGDAKGADWLARAWGKYNGWLVECYPADWKKHGPAAGQIRNKQMLDEGKPDLVIAFMYSDSRGTKNMVAQAEKAGVETKVIHCV